MVLRRMTTGVKTQFFQAGLQRVDHGMKETRVIDGAYGEGGGQIIRTSLSLSAITGTPVEIVNVRKGRSKPGLQPQHLMAVRSAAEICAANVEGAEVGSTRFTFHPGCKPVAGSYHFDIRTAGATPLVAQTLLVPLAHADGDSSVTVIGGTHVPHAPTFEYLQQLYAPLLRRAGLDVEVEYEAAGFFPRGGGRILLRVRPAAFLQPVDLTERGKLENLTAYIVTSGVPDHVADRGAATVEKAMKAVGRPVHMEIRRMPSPGSGAAVILVAKCEGGYAGFTGLGERGKPMEKVAEAPCREFLEWWKTGAACDEHLADQLVLPAALAHGESRWTTPTVTDHLRTVLWVAQQFLPVQATLEEGTTGSALVQLRGVCK